MMRISSSSLLTSHCPLVKEPGTCLSLVEIRFH